MIAVLTFTLSANTFANFCAQDAVPAATLLFPYIAVDIKADGTPDFAGQTTISRLTNAAPVATIVHFTVWDVSGVPHIDFDEILSGYDVLQINWRDFANGRFDMFDTSKTAFTIPSSSYGYMKFDPFEWGPDGRGQAGGLITPPNRNAITSATCGSVPPYGNRSDLAVTIRNLLGASSVAREHAGCYDPARLRADQQSWTDLRRPSPLVFYVTADVVKRCNLYFPDKAEYWQGVADTANVLIGDVIYLDPTANTSEMMPAVHIEAASGTDGGPSVTGFYEERSGAETNREPLATAFMLSYANDSAASLHSNLIVWKNFTELAESGKVIDCGSYAYYAWDMDERSLSQNDHECCCPPCTGIDHNQLPFVTQKVALDSRYFDLPAFGGWFMLVLPPSYGSVHVDPTPDEEGYLARPYMGWAALQLSFGTYSAGSTAITMANALCFPNQTLPVLGVNGGTTPIR